MKETKELILKLQALMSSMQEDLSKALLGNCRAAQRARAISVKIGKESLKFRRVSMKTMGRKV
jgi:hypothetical protein